MIQEAVFILVMAKCRIGHFAEAQILEAIEIDYIDESEVLTPADDRYHIDKRDFTVPFVCGCRNLGEALRRQGGGGGGGGGARRGAGEAKLELDRRHLHHRIEHLEGRLKELEKRRGETRRARQKNNVPVVALVGYTNVGKSSLLNALCGEQIFEADMLVATLDPTARKLVLPSGLQIILVDTVGFVSRLPHHLVEAFKSTLEEAAWSDVIIRVADAGDDQREEQLSVTDEVLDGLDCTDIPRLTVYNKCDKPNTLSFAPDILLTSAKPGYGLDTLLQKLDELLSDRVHTLRVLLPSDTLAKRAVSAMLPSEVLPSPASFMLWQISRASARLYSFPNFAAEMAGAQISCHCFNSSSFTSANSVPILRTMEITSCCSPAIDQPSTGSAGCALSSLVLAALAAFSLTTET